MTVTITWEAVAALGVFLTAVAGFCVWAVGAIVERKLWKLNGYYVRSEKSTLTGAEIERRLEHLESVRS